MHIMHKLFIIYIYVHYLVVAGFFIRFFITANTTAVRSPAVLINGVTLSCPLTFWWGCSRLKHMQKQDVFMYIYYMSLRCT